MPLSLVTAPQASQILEIEDAKLQLRVDGTVEESLIAAQVAGVYERAELQTRRALLTQTWDYVLDAFPASGWIEIPKPPLVSVTYIRYVDTAGVTQTLATSVYRVQAPAGPRCRRGRIGLTFGSVWPVTLDQIGAVTVRFVAGYGDAPADVPGLLLTAMRMDLATVFVNREGVVIGESVAELPGGVRDIYRSYRSYPAQVGG